MLLNDTEEVLHRIRVTLHKSNLPNAKGAYYSHTDSEAKLSIEDVAASAIKRGALQAATVSFPCTRGSFLASLPICSATVSPSIPVTFQYTPL